MFRDDVDRTVFCNRLAATIKKHKWTLIGFVLMPTHFHLVARVVDDVLQTGMRDAFGPYAQEFNRRHGRSGHLKAGPYKLRRVDDEASLAVAVRYVVRNPVQAGLCRLPQDWYWSSYRGLAGYATAFQFVDDALALPWFDEDPVKARQRLRIFMEAA